MVDCCKEIQKGLSVVIPVFNEEGAILSTITSINGIFEQAGIENYELIIVNDGSTDKTSEILKENENLSFRLLEHDQNKGYGRSLKTGILASNYDVVAITDADGTYPNERMPELFSEIKNHDMVVGSRNGEEVKIPLIRKPAKFVLRTLANYLAEYKIPDLNSGLRIFRKDKVLPFFGILPNGFSFTTTITLAMLTNSLKVKFVPINYLKRKGKSKIRPISDTLNFLLLICRTIIYFNPLKIFIPASVMFLLSSIIIFFYSLFFMNKILNTSVLILFVTSIQLLATGLIADLIDKRSHNITSMGDCYEE